MGGLQGGWDPGPPTPLLSRVPCRLLCADVRVDFQGIGAAAGGAGWQGTCVAESMYCGAPPALYQAYLLCALLSARLADPLLSSSY